MTTLADLLQPVSEEDANALIIGVLQSLGFPSTSWQTLSVPRFFVRTVARIYSSATTNVANIAAGGLLDAAAALKSPVWLRLLAKSAYDIDYNQARPTIGVFQLADAGSNGPTSLSVGQVVIQTPDGKLRWTSNQAGTIPQNGVLPLSCTAEAPGSVYNIASNYPGLELVTTLPGVVVTNPIPVGGTSWITTAGADDEANDDLADRCRTKWATLGTGGQRDAYANWARTGSPNITRVDVDDTNPDGPGTVRVTVATDAGPADAGSVAAADAYIQARRALTATVTTQSAAGLIVTVAATLFVPAAQAALALATAIANLTAVIDATPIGGTIYFSSVIFALKAGGLVRNVESCTINGVAGDVVLTSGQVPSLSTDITTKVF